jgi:hypothetical protein
MNPKKVLVLLFALAAILMILSTTGMAGDEEQRDTGQKSQITPDDSLSQPDAEKNQPKIYFPETRHDFGEASQLESLTHVFKVENRGDVPLEIKKVSAS